MSCSTPPARWWSSERRCAERRLAGPRRRAAWSTVTDPGADRSRAWWHPRLAVVSAPGGARHVESAAAADDPCCGGAAGCGPGEEHEERGGHMGGRAGGEAAADDHGHVVGGQHPVDGVEPGRQRQCRGVRSGCRAGRWTLPGRCGVRDHRRYAGDQAHRVRRRGGDRAADRHGAQVVVAAVDPLVRHELRARRPCHGARRTRRAPTGNARVQVLANPRTGRSGAAGWTDRAHPTATQRPG